MSLIERAMETSHIMDKTTELDEYGSVRTVYKQGAEIKVAYSFNSSTEARIGAQQGANNRVTLMTKRSVLLRFQDVIRRDRDGKTFRVTSDGDDNKTPETAGLNLRAVEAEQWEIPSDEQTAGV